MEIKEEGTRHILILFNCKKDMAGSVDFLAANAKSSAQLRVKGNGNKNPQTRRETKVGVSLHKGKLKDYDGVCHPTVLEVEICSRSWENVGTTIVLWDLDLKCKALALLGALLQEGEEACRKYLAAPPLSDTALTQHFYSTSLVNSSPQPHILLFH